MAKVGTFIWHELMTSDVDAAKAFYSEVMGWKTKAMDGPMDYTLFSVGEREMAGLMLLPEEVKAHGAPNHWLGHVEVADAGAAAKRVEELGGTILAPVQDVPGIGSFAVTQDPQGAVIGAFCPTESRDQPAPGNGHVSWNELNTTDGDSAWQYYSALFGWTETESMDMGPELGAYRMYKWQGAENSVGGISNVAKVQNVPPHWLYYITADDIDAAVERVKTRGGSVLNGPMEVPGGDRVAQCMDPQGAAFGLHANKPE